MADEIELVYLDLTGAERKTLHRALVDAFDRANLAELLSFNLDERLDAVTSGGSLSEVVLSLIAWAEQQGRVLQLMRAAHDERPGNTEVTVAFQIIEKRAAAERARPKAPDADDAAAETTAPNPKRPGPAPGPLRDDGKTGWDFKPVSPQTGPGAPTAALGPINVVQGLPMVMHPQGLSPGPGMSLAMTGMVNHAAGRTMQLVVRFLFPNGAWLYAAPMERAFRDAAGYCAVGTMPMPVSMDPVQLDGFVMSIPYYVLNLTPTNWQMVYQLSAVGTVYVDNAPIAQSMPTPFQVRW